MKFQEGLLNLNEHDDMYYVSFGTGSKNLVLIPGLGDGFSTVNKNGFVLSRYYRKFGKDFRIFVLSRKNQLDELYSTREMASDYIKAMDVLNIDKASVYGVSQGGMIAQYLAIDYPERIEKLVLAITVARPNETTENVIGSWIAMAKAKRFSDLVVDTMKKTYTPKHFKKYRLVMPLIRMIVKPKFKNRFIVQANACLTHNAFDELNKIQSKTFIIGGDTDNVVGRNSSQEMATEITNNILKIYHGQGHGAYEEIKTFNDEVMNFLLNNE